MECIKCSYTRHPEDDHFVPATECPRCGLVYAKAQASHCQASVPDDSWRYFQPRRTCQYAGFWVRFWAACIDELLLALLSVPLLYYLYGPGIFTAKELCLDSRHFFISHIVPAVATVIFWRRLAATPGKMVISAKVVDAQTGQKLTMGQCIVRYLAYMLSALPFFLGFIWMAFDSKKQGWHDKLAGTLVVH